MAEFGKIAIFGAGLIGGSFALALKAAHAVEEVVAFGRTPASLKEALELGLIDRAGINPAHEMGDADLVLIATPVAQMSGIMERIAPYLGAQTIVTDGGSTKCDVVAAARMALGEKISQFVPAHPIAGAENSGPSAARHDLYQGKKVVVTPLPENDDETLDHVKRAWSLCGADIYELTPEYHDRVFAAVSHLPHLLSYALVHDLAVREDSEMFFTFAASGFRDFTRIAASHPEMWRDICLANREALVGELDRYLEGLGVLRQALQASDGETLAEYFGIARQARRAWAKS
ncbi:MAG: prephenate dehydrogenase [Proteobacteria bacterium]|nr:prephenate dehydrogenase [Pseudomonadota bacterium]